MSNTKPEIEVPEEFQEWVSEWLFKHVESAPIDLDEHVRVTTFCRAIVYQAYRHLSPSSRPAIGPMFVKASDRLPNRGGDYNARYARNRCVLDIRHGDIYEIRGMAGEPIRNGIELEWLEWLEELESIPSSEPAVHPEWVDSEDELPPFDADKEYNLRYRDQGGWEPVTGFFDADAKQFYAVDHGSDFTYFSLREYPGLQWLKENVSAEPAKESQSDADFVICPSCGGDGKETCNNPDHGFIESMPGETGRLGCPGCGHDPNHKVNRGKNTCPLCGGHGHVWYDVAEDWAKETGYDDEFVPYVPPAPPFVKPENRKIESFGIGLQEEFDKYAPVPKPSVKPDEVHCCDNCAFLQVDNSPYQTGHSIWCSKGRFDGIGSYAEADELSNPINCYDFLSRKASVKPEREENRGSHSPNFCEIHQREYWGTCLACHPGFGAPHPPAQPSPTEQEGEREDMTDQECLEMLKDANASLQSQLSAKDKEAQEYRKALEFVKESSWGAAHQNPIKTVVCEILGKYLTPKPTNRE